MKRTQGISLLELLVAISILVTVLGMASAGVIMALRAQKGQEAVTSSQAKLRRVNEAVLQELRGAVLGGVTNEPVPAGPNSVSFTVIDGGAGYKVQDLQPAQLTFIAPADLEFDGGQVLLVNSEGEARVLSVEEPRALGDNRFISSYTPCNNPDPFPIADDTLMFNVRTIGFSYDVGEQTLKQTVGDGAALPLAYDMSEFTIDYIYQRDDGSYAPNETPYLYDADGNIDNLPDRTGYDDESNFLQLARLNITLGTSAPGIGGRAIKRYYTGQLGLLDTANDERFRSVKGVKPCTVPD